MITLFLPITQNFDPLVLTVYMLNGLQFGIWLLFVLMIFVVVKWLIGIVM